MKKCLGNNPHNFEEIFNADAQGHQPIKVCSNCGAGFDIKDDRWYTAKELWIIKKKLSYMKEAFVR